MTDPGITDSGRPGGPTDGGPSTDAAAALAARLEETASELARLDPHLGGLFRAGHAMLERLTEPGLVYLVAHCGRELATGVVRVLTPDVPELLDGERASVPSDARVLINVARVLGERPDHPSVTRWVQVARALQEEVHVRVGEEGSPPVPDGVRAAYLALSDLLYGRLAPFFTAQAELEALAAIPVPGPGDLERLRPLLLRPAQRQRFFGELAHAGWLPLLRDGHFLTAPTLVAGADGQRRARPWVEGRYLERIAPDAPEPVRDVLAAIPLANDNPLVWHTVVDAACALPVDAARPLVAPILRAIRTPHMAVWCAHVLVTLAARLAVARVEEAFTLADALLWLPRRPPPRAAETPTAPGASRPDDAPRDEAAHLTALRRLARRRTQNTAWMLERLDPHEFERVIERVVPPLEQADGVRTLTLLATKLAHAVRLGVAADAEDDAQDAYADRGDDASDETRPDGGDAGTGSTPQDATVPDPARAEPSHPPHATAVDAANAPGADVPGGTPRATQADESHHWAEWLDRPGPDADVRHQLATTLTAVARRLAAAGSDAAAAVDAVLRTHAWDVFARIRLLTLAAAGEHAPQDLVDEVLDGPDVLTLPYRGREVAAFLRAQFGRASAQGQGRYAARLGEGPPPERLAALVEAERWWRGQRRDETGGAGTAAPDDATLAAEVLQDWQRRRLRFFHATIPPALRGLADALGITPEVPSLRDQAMNEVGTWSSGVRSRGWRSPVDPDALVHLAPDALFARLAEWPAAAERDAAGRWDPDAPVAASRTGLLSALTDAAGKAPAWGAGLAAEMAVRLEVGAPWAVAEDAAAHVAALLSGFAFREGALTPASWPGVRDLAHAVWRQPPSDQPGERRDEQARAPHAIPGLALWQEPARLAVDVLRKFAEQDQLHLSDARDAWECLTTAVESPALWDARPRRSPSRARPAAPPASAGGDSSTSGSDGESAVALGRLAEHAEQSPAGRLFRTTVALASWHLYAPDTQEPKGDPPVPPPGRAGRRPRTGEAALPSAARRRSVGARARAVLTRWFDASTRAGEEPAAELLLGTELAFLHWLAGRWVRRRVLPRLGDGGAPVGAPAWGGYLTHGQVTRSLFGRLRDLYLVGAARDADRPRREDAQHDRIGTGLAAQAVRAALIGAVGLRHPSDVVARVFGGVDPRDRARVYWQLFRGVSDAPGGPAPWYVRRLLAFWDWRLRAMEADDAGADPDRRASASTEAAEMLWLLAAPGLAPVGAVLALGVRTARLARQGGRGVDAVWDRLGPLAATWPGEVFEVFELLVGRALRDRVPYLPAGPVTEVLRGALRHTPDVRARARRLVDRMGEHNEFRFRGLLAEADEHTT